MDLIDTHCHLDVAEFEQDRAQVLARCHALGITQIVVPAVTVDGWEHLLAVCRSAPGLYPALGLHPLYIDRHLDADIAALERALAQHRVVAVGEIGLDFYMEHTDRARQQAVFEAQLGVARAAGLPVLLHVRKAHEQVLAALRRSGVCGGIAHAFNGSLQQAEQYIELGFKLGFGGTLTYERALKIRSLARQLPLEAMVLETDAPDMVVAAHRNERNSPEYLVDCLNALAQIREEAPELIARQTSRNARELLNLEG